MPMSQDKSFSKQTLDASTMHTIYNHGFKILGDFWTLHIIYVLHCAGGELRFNELQRQNVGISPSLLSGRLKKLEQLGLVRRQVTIAGRLAASYQLTEKGQGMMPILHAMFEFSQKYLS